ncbi:hypothetical protein EDC30_109127 [Paucimonas lemoignei]|uniref:Transcriptional regulator n=1 Tax=Paucimonas lemoignei TaxID=29443 RepID=A0A4R3HSB3_PAULE|nr:hypothetical protein [Paucimonas lemoignei]TCS35828.1 hypothetical protein EDC30_109127 [Paucimonas lemoignei]
MKTSQLERDQFTERLCSVLEQHQYDPKKVTNIAREFNVRSPDKVTIHGVRKWLKAESIPAQGHLRVLSDWLGVDAAWLRFGGKEEQPKAKPSPINKTVLLIAAEIDGLPAEGLAAVRAVIRAIKTASMEAVHG